MEKVFNNITELIGNTPLVELKVFGKAYCPKARLLAKLEYFNPAGSVKDRVALSIIRKAEHEGKLKKGGVIIEATSGNTGVGIAAISSVLGYKAVIVMPDNMSIERIKLIKAYGAEVVLTEGSKGMEGAVKKAEEIKNKNNGSIIAGQFENPANPEVHYKYTGPEIWTDTDGKVDAFVAGVGTGGTLSGTGRYLKEKSSLIKIVAVEPNSSALLSGETAGSHGIQGIGANFVPEVLDTSIYDEVVRVTDSEAFSAMCELSAVEGLFVGISSGAAAIAAAKVAGRPEYDGKTVVVIFPDTGERYISII